MDLFQLISALQNPEIYSEHPAKVELVQTHISVIFLVGDLVYKIKKPVDFGFLDFTTLEKRKYFCEQEVILNRRLCPEIYLGVVEIRKKDGKIFIGKEGGEVVEYAVLMKKLPAEKMMDHLLAQGKVSPSLIQKLASKIALFHMEAQSGEEISSYGQLQVIRQNIEENFAQTEKYIGQSLPLNSFQDIKENAYRFLTRRKSLFAQRIKLGMIRDGHGDLHLKHICFHDEILIFDCIEFNDRFRYGDVAADIAFLLMDLDYHGYPQLSADLAAYYLRNTKDWPLYLLLNFYKSYRAYVRGKVTSFRLEEKELTAQENEIILKEAQQYFSLAHYYAQRMNEPAIFMVGGLIGTGKSTIARALGNQLNWPILSSDVIRKELAHLTPQTRCLENFQQGIYSPDFSHKTYQALWAKAEQILHAGDSVILDASFNKKKYREMGLELASRCGAKLLFLECLCPEEVIKKRLAQRAGDTEEASDGRWEIFADWQKDYEEVKELNPSIHLVLDTRLSLDELLGSIFHYLLRQEAQDLEKANWQSSTEVKVKQSLKRGS